MNKTCVVQYAIGKSLEYLNLTKKLHQQFCKKHNYDYIVKNRNDAPDSLHVSWNKPILIKEVCDKEYDHVIWLDSDVIWLGDCLNHITVKPFGCTFHFCPVNGGFHFNNGVIVINNSNYTKRLLNEWLNTSDEDHVWAEQWAFNKMIYKNPLSIQILDHAWNSVQHSLNHRSNNPKIVAWHGRPDLAYNEMKQYLSSQEIGG